MSKRYAVSINPRPVASHYADERIIEFSSPNGGGLIAFLLSDDGTLTVEPYRLDDTVKVRLPRAEAMTEYTIQHDEPSPQSVRSLRAWTQTRGPGEELTDLVTVILDAIGRGLDVTITPSPSHYDITTADVGRSTIRAFGQTWAVSDFLGRVLPTDVGKRVRPVLDDAGRITHLSVESDAQLQQRLGTITT